MGDGQNFPKNFRASLLNDNLSNDLISDRSISLDSTSTENNITTLYIP